jgi:cytochrome c551/c552
MVLGINTAGAEVDSSGPQSITLPAETASLEPAEMPGYTLATQKCLICHSVDYIHYQPPGRNLQQWTAEVRKMQHAYGAPLSDSEIEQIGAYLAVVYGAAKIDDADVAAVMASARQTPGETEATIVDVDELIAGNACLGCHAVDSHVLGPSFREVAQRYRDNNDARSTVAQHIRGGGSGRWGQIPMPPMAALSDAEALALADYILGL